MRGWLSPLLAGLVVLCPCAPAQAETAYLTGNGQSKTLHIDGAPGEVNQPQIWPVNDNGSLIYWVRDVTTFPVAGAGCSQWDVDVVSCPQGPVIAFNVSLGDQNDSFSTTQPLAIPMQLSGGDGNDLLTAGDGADTVSGGPGDDTIGAEGLGADVYNGGTGTDLITFGRTGNQSITLDDVANDGLAAEGDNAHSDFEAVSAGGGDDTITGTSGPDTINGGGGTDVIHGGGGDDNLTLYGCGTVDAGTGNDVITTNLACAGLAISGGDDVDRLDLSIATSAMQASLNGLADDGPIGAGAVNVPADIENITGSPYGDVLTGDAQANAIDGGAGDDLLDGAGGPDTLAGGNGSDAVDYSSRTVPLNVDLDGQPADDGEAGEGDTVGTDVEGIYGGSAADVLTGGPGDDLLDGGPGADQLAGGGGEDVVDYSARTAAVSADADGAVGDDGESGEGDSIAADVEDLIGGAGNDTLTGNSAANYIRGGSGSDLIAGGDGDDVLVGEDGDDSLDGGTGLDQFFADAGDDTIAMRDDVGEPAYCGDGADSVTADAADVADADCETVSVPDVPPAVQPLPPRTAPIRTPVVHTPLVRNPLVQPSTPAPDLTAPKATIVAVKVPVKRAVAHGIRFQVSCDEECATDISLALSVKQLKRLGFVHAKRAVVVARGSHADTDATKYVIVVRFLPTMRRRLAKAPSLRLEVRALFTDLLNNQIRRRPSILKLSR